VISSAADLAALHSQVGWLGSYHPRDSYRFQLPSLTEEDNARLSARLNGYTHECGCAAGGFLLSLCAVTASVLFFMTGGTLASVGWRQVGWLMGSIVTAAAVGKLAAILVARRKAVHLVHAVAAGLAT
jgi:hypothetical protein